MNLLNGVRGLASQPETFLSQIQFYQLMIDNFEYQKAGLQKHQVRDFQVLYLGEILRIYKQELLKEIDLKTEHVRDVSGGPILNMLSVLSQRTIAQFESRQAEVAEAVNDNVGFNLLFAIVISNITKSHQKTKQTIKEAVQEDYEQEILTSGESISTNTILEEARHLVSILEGNIDNAHQMPFGKFQPARIWTSNILLSFIYYLQDDIETQSKSLENLMEVFLIKRISYDSKHDFALNCILFYTLLSHDPIMQKYVDKLPSTLLNLVNVLNLSKQVEIADDQYLNKASVLNLNLTHNICLLLKNLMTKHPNLVCSSILPHDLQKNIMKTTKEQLPAWEKSTDFKWLVPLTKEIWFTIIGFQSQLPDTEEQIPLELKFLVQLEQDGFQGSLNFYKPASISTKRRTDVQDQQRINEVKTLIQYVYAFQPIRPKDPNSVLYQKPTTLTQKNVYFKCLISLIDTSGIRQQLENGQFDDAHLSLAKSLIGTKCDKLVKSGLVAKLFLVCLFITLNSIDKGFVEKARIICLTTIPLMFTEINYRQQVEAQIRQQVVSSLIHFESKQFYSFVKRVFKNEEQYNLENHFEKYFSLSGFLRDLLNEIIKLQASPEAPNVQPRMLLKVMDMITYFFSGVSLRRSPVTEDDSFIFANLIDFKSFEFLSKLYKISERLVDYDTENMTIMNMWYKVCEGRESNFEVLGKFLIHNLSSFVLKVTSDKNAKGQIIDPTSEQEFEKHKRYSLSIYNYIKARTQQMDVRASMEINSATWSQKMLKIVLRTRLNLTSKYTLEKVKLKKVLEMLHSEVNQSEQSLKLRGGIDTVVDIIGAKGDVRQSVSMSQLIQSQTFLNTFSNHNQSNRATLRQLLFIIDRQMYDKFIELTPEVQVAKMPELLIRYFENTLILIANESERLQIIKFTPKEEITVVVLLLTLIADLALEQSQTDSNRAYFLYDLLYKLSVSVYGVQKYIKSIPIEQFCKIQTEHDILLLFNSRNTLDVFPLFTSVWYKVIENITVIPKLFSFMLSLWNKTLIKHHAVIQKEQSYQILFSRSQVRHMLKVCFSIIHQTSKSENQFKLHQQNFQQAVENIIELVQPTAKHQASFQNFNSQSSCDIAYGTNACYWLGYACLVDQPFQQVGLSIIKRILEDSEFYKQLLNLQKVPATFNSLKLPQLQSSLLQVLFNVLGQSQVSEDVFKCLIVTIKAQDSLLTSNTDTLAQEELHRFLLLLPYLMSQFTVQDLTQSIAVFSNKRSIVQLLKKSLPSISITTKSKILNILDIIQREVDQDDQVLVYEQFMLLIEEVRDQLLQQDFGLQVLGHCQSTLKQMINNKVDSVRLQVLQDCLTIIQNQQDSSDQIKIDWTSQILGEEVQQIDLKVRTVYFSLKHIILKEIEMSACQMDCQQFFTGGETSLNHQPLLLVNRSNTSDPNNKMHSKGPQADYQQEPFKPTHRKSFSKKPQLVSKYQNTLDFVQNQANPNLNSSNNSYQLEKNVYVPPPKIILEVENQTKETKIVSPLLKHAEYNEQSDDEVQMQFNVQNQPVTHNSLLGTFAKDNKREMVADEMQISQQISSISGASIKDNDRSIKMTDHRLNEQLQDRPQTGAFTKEFDFSVDHPGHQYQQFRQTQPIISNPKQQLEHNDKSKVLVDLKQNWVQSSSSQINTSNVTQDKLVTKSQGKRTDFERQLKLISKDDDVLYELEQHLLSKGMDLDQLAFYIKVLDFKSEGNNRNIIAGLILDNYLSEEAEFYIGDQFTDAVINDLINHFQSAIQLEKQVSLTMFDQCCQILKPSLEKQVLEFMSK